MVSRRKFLKLLGLVPVVGVAKALIPAEQVRVYPLFSERTEYTSTGIKTWSSLSNNWGDPNSDGHYHTQEPKTTVSSIGIEEMMEVAQKQTGVWALNKSGARYVGKIKDLQ